MISLIVAVFLSIGPVKTDIVDYVDVIEANYVVRDQQIAPTFEQSIYYRWKRTWVKSPATDKVEWIYGFEIVDWRKLDVTGMPRKNWKTGKWEQRFWDNRDLCYRKIIAKSYRKTKTNYDPEVEARKLVNTGNRDKLTKPRNRK